MGFEGAPGGGGDGRLTPGRRARRIPHRGVEALAVRAACDLRPRAEAGFMGTGFFDCWLRVAALLVVASCLAAASPDEPLPPPGDAEQVPPVEAEKPAEAGDVTAPTEPPKSPEDEAARRQAVRWAVEGYLSEELDYRNASGEASDNDLDSRTNLLLDATRGERGWHFRLNGLLHWDMAGESAPDAPLRDFWDQFDSDFQGRLYEAYVDLPMLADDTVLVRLGRQYLEEEVFLQFDGGRVDVDLGHKVDGLNFSLIGGVPVYFPDESREGDWLVGFVARGKLGEKTRARVSYYHVSQNFDGINDPVTDPAFQAFVVPAGQVDDDLLGFSLWHDFAENVRFYGFFDFLEWDPNELQLQLRWFTRDTRWTVIAEYDELFDRLVNVANEISPYVPLLGAYQPFLLANLRATFRPNEQWAFQGGIAYRTLEDSSDEGTFNHEYWQYQAGATRFGVLAEKLDATLTLNGYSSSAGPDLFALTGGLDYQVNTRVSLSGGIDYAYYKYVVQQGSELDNVWTYYVNVKWEIRPKMELDAGVDIDVDDLFTYTLVTVRFTVRF